PSSVGRASRPLTYPLLPYTTLFRSLDAQLDATGRRRELRGVVQQIRHDLREPDGVRIDDHRLLRLDRHDLVRARLDQRTARLDGDRKSTRLNSSHVKISYAVFCLKK